MKTKARRRDELWRSDLSLRHRRDGLDAIDGADLGAERAADAQAGVDLHLMATLERLLAPGDRRTADVHAGLAGIALLFDHLERRTLDLDRIEHARPVGDQHGDAAIID